MKTLTTDLDNFIPAFGIDIHRRSEGKIEYRVQDLDRQIHRARNLIKKKGYALEAVTEGSMAQIRAFYVKEV